MALLFPRIRLLYEKLTTTTDAACGEKFTMPLANKGILKLRSQIISIYHS